jgi:tetratricopeptide (TPR) repeat protein
MFVAVPIDLKSYLEMAPAWAEDALLRLSAAEALTDEFAVELIQAALGDKSDASRFVAALHYCTFMETRNSEWHFAPETRRYLLSKLHATPELFATINRQILAMRGQVAPPLSEIRPAYLVTDAGNAYHTTTVDLQRGLKLYTAAFRDELSGEQWLLGHLAEEQQSLEIIPDHAIEPSFLRGMTSYREGKLDEASVYFERVIKSDEIRLEVSASLHLLAMIVRARQEDLNRAQSLLERSLSIDVRLGNRTKQAEVHNSLGAVLRDRGELERAKAEFELARIIWQEKGDTRNLAWVLSSLGSLLRDTGELDAAKGSFARAVHLRERERDKRGLASALLGLGGVLRDRGELDAARDALVRALAIREEENEPSEVARVLVRLGGLLRERGELDDAKAALVRALAILEKGDNPPAIASALLGLGAVLRDRGEFDAASDAFVRAQGIADDAGDQRILVTVLSNLASLRHECGALDDAKDALIRAQRILEMSGKHEDLSWVLNSLADVYRDNADVELAVETYRKVLDAAQDAPSNFKARIRRTIRDLTAWIPELAKARSDVAQSTEKLAQYFLWNGKRLFAMKDDNAKVSLERAATFPLNSNDLAEIHNALGLADFRKLRYDQAVAHFAQAVALGYDDTRLRAAYGRSLSELGADLPTIEEHFKISLQLDRTNTLALCWYARVLAVAPGRYAEGEELAKRAADLKPNDPVVLNNVARILMFSLNRDKLREAEQLLRKAIAVGPAGFIWPKRTLDEVLERLSAMDAP